MMIIFSKSIDDDDDDDADAGCNELGWMHSHNALRFEMKELLEAMKAMQRRVVENKVATTTTNATTTTTTTKIIKGRIADWEINCLQIAWASHAVHVRGHHSNEDHVFVPFLKKRFKYPEQVSRLHNTVFPFFFLHSTSGEDRKRTGTKK